MKKEHLEKLRELQASEENRLVKKVIDIVITECEGDLEKYLIDLEIYCEYDSLDTSEKRKKFFLEYMDDIFNCVNSYTNNCGQFPYFEELNYNSLAEFGFVWGISIIESKLGFK